MLLMFNATRGTKDILPQEQSLWRFVQAKASTLSKKYGFRRLDTPVFEDSRLFSRSVGETTDIMEKETYTFADRGGDYLTLRPEGTAPVCRSYLEHGMQNLPQPVRLYYFCPVFRYDRPQSGRYRQHYQYGVEVIGDGDPLVDMEIIAMSWNFIKELGLQNTSLYINSIGDSKCRPNYIKNLTNYYSSRISKMCAMCKNRFSNNPLRLLDCKKEVCQELQKEAPGSIDHLCEECQSHWDNVCSYLSVAGIPYMVNNRLVRGLDYYTRTVFEIQPLKAGSQSTLLGGGRYDGLIEQLGGRPTPGIGFATGFERIIMNLQQQNIQGSEDDSPEYFVISVSDENTDEIIKLVSVMRDAGTRVIMGSRGKSLKGQLRNANSLGIPKVLIVGEEERASGMITLRDMANGTQTTVPVSEFLDNLLSEQNTT